ncbi:(R)-1-hydroxy-2-aminoethylphosphonate ammonia-lyase [Flagellimonas zhangzhouensis]|uniref:4-aminobutyrate aminotransferase apoenzyme n=1 Tax=Flagellimonas zhangzhouensis TaxID=1073328 RepID=A0A1H2U8T7_9FLAO|nr:aspartate aminotransferase family protein [Allomuricauda zhangzhouensis]SDQ19286.1 4-aminobutyrate aminotransferase apoenzyme [Allomuricauda zhangzhouensis]SDW52347.1 4-aminobutyrate aminotransferase apoenzyme [Allomuricauda zhangzhouensis]
MDHIKRDKHNSESVVEGDINLTPARKEWLQNEVSEETKELLEKDAKYFMHQSMSTPCLDVLKNCEGSYIESVSGKKYLDFHGNNVHQIGFSHPKMIARLTEQLQGLTFSTRRYANETAIQFAEKLTSYTPKGLNRILLTPNGSSAIGIALKLARAVTGKHKVVSFWDSFHGANLDAISVGGESIFQEHMGPMMPGVERIPPPITYRGIFEGNEAKALEYLEYVLEKDNQIGAFLAEIIRNTDVQIPSDKFWKGARELCTKHGVLLILDEIPIAFGRTGKMFAYELFGIEPDILCLGKGLGGGIIPQAAIVTRDEYNKFGDISLGHYTHEKSPLGSIAGLTLLEVIEEENLLQKVKEDQEFMRKALYKMHRKYSLIGDIRGVGLLWGIELVSDRTTKEKATAEAEEIMYECLKQGLSFKVSKGNVLQLSPPLTITREELEKAFEILNCAFLKTNAIA